MNLPQNFTRIGTDPETCARTHLIYVHPPLEEKPASVPKVSGTYCCVEAKPHPIFLFFQLHPQVVQRLTGPLPPPSHPPLSSSHTNSKVPIITNYAPQLPMGPGPILQFPFHYPQIGTAPMVAVTSAGNVAVPTASSHSSSYQRRTESLEPAATVREVKRIPSREEEFAFHMRQQQQLLQQAAVAQQQHAHVHPHAQLVTPHLVQGRVG